MLAVTPLLDRLADKFEIDGATGCWLWTAYIGSRGYGTIWNPGGSAIAHRAMYEEVVEPIAKGLVIDHLCRTHRCVNPDHLEVVTPRENIIRGDGPAVFAAGAARWNAWKTHCINGHPFDEANTYYRPTGGRSCKECGLIRHGRGTL